MKTPEEWAVSLGFKFIDDNDPIVGRISGDDVLLELIKAIQADAFLAGLEKAKEAAMATRIDRDDTIWCGKKSIISKIQSLIDSTKGEGK